MRGKYSKNEFFKNFPKIIQIYFQGSESNTPEDVQALFKKAKNKINLFQKKKEKPRVIILLDELGLAERSKSNQLKALYKSIEYSGKDEGVSFVGISNYTFDAAKINRALVLSVPDLDNSLDDLIDTSQNIVESIFDRIKVEKIFEIISKTYFSYKKQLQFIKELVVYKKYKKYVSKNKENKNINIDKITEQISVKSDKNSKIHSNSDNENKEKEKKEEEEEKELLKKKSTSHFLPIFFINFL